MSVLFPLEDFSQAAQGGASLRRTAEATDAVACEKARLDGYEAGYQAGWDDAVRAEAQNQARIGEEFARNMQDLGFSFHEARSHVMRGLEPLLDAMVASVLPRIAADSLGLMIREELMPLAAEACDKPIEIVAASRNIDMLEELVAQVSAIPVTLVVEPTLAEGQVFLRLGAAEKCIDLGDVVDRIGTGIRALYEINERAVSNG